MSVDFTRMDYRSYCEFLVSGFKKVIENKTKVADFYDYILKRERERNSKAHIERILETGYYAHYESNVDFSKSKFEHQRILTHYGACQLLGNEKFYNKLKDVIKFTNDVRENVDIMLAFMAGNRVKTEIMMRLIMLENEPDEEKRKYIVKYVQLVKSHYGMN